MPDSKWTIDDTVVLSFCICGFGGGIATAKMGLPPVVVALLLATGVASLIYRFLGGIGESNFTIGALKLTGTAAFLVGMTWFVNAKLEGQMAKSQSASDTFSATDLVGHTWRWDWGPGGFTGDFYFTLDKDKKVAFSGKEQRCASPMNCSALYEVTNGRADIIDGGLWLRAHVHDIQYNRDFDWQTVQPLKKTVAFEGSMQNPVDTSQSWGISLFKRTY